MGYGYEIIRLGCGMKRSDLWFLGVVLGAAVLIWLGYVFWYGEEGAVVRVTVDGAVYGEYPLDEKNRVKVECEDGNGFNEIVIEGGKASVVSADCPDGLCVKQRAVSRTGESIICLPHKLVITIIGGEEAEYDGIAG